MSTQIPEENPSVVSPEEEAPSQNSFLRLGIMVVALLALAVVAKLMGWEKAFHPKALKATIINAGIIGYLLYLVIFVVSGFLQVPGMVIVIAGTYIYGKLVGFLLAFLGGTMMLNAHFLVIRWAGGKAFQRIDKPWVQKLLARLDERPIWIVVLLRVPMPLTPPLNYILALTNLSHRQYFWGSFLGLIGPLLFVVTFSDFVMRWIGL